MITTVFGCVALVMWVMIFFAAIAVLMDLLVEFVDAIRDRASLSDLLADRWQMILVPFVIFLGTAIGCAMMLP